MNSFIRKGIYLSLLSISLLSAAGCKKEPAPTEEMLAEPSTQEKEFDKELTPIELMSAAYNNFCKNPQIQMKIEQESYDDSHSEILLSWNRATSEYHKIDTWTAMGRANVMDENGNWYQEDEPSLFGASENICVVLENGEYITYQWEQVLNDSINIKTASKEKGYMPVDFSFERLFSLAHRMSVDDSPAYLDNTPCYRLWLNDYSPNATIYISVSDLRLMLIDDDMQGSLEFIYEPSNICIPDELKNIPISDEPLENQKPRELFPMVNETLGNSVIKYSIDGLSIELDMSLSQVLTHSGSSYSCVPQGFLDITTFELSEAVDSLGLSIPSKSMGIYKASDGNNSVNIYALNSFKSANSVENCKVGAFSLDANTLKNMVGRTMITMDLYQLFGSCEIFATLTNGMQALEWKHADYTIIAIIDDVRVEEVFVISDNYNVLLMAAKSFLNSDLY